MELYLWVFYLFRKMDEKTPDKQTPNGAIFKMTKDNKCCFCGSRENLSNKFQYHPKHGIIFHLGLWCFVCWNMDYSES